jgi:WD40 repeat protein
VDPVADAISYSWTLPAGATFSGPSTGNSITVNFGAGAASGNITVTGVNGCGNSLNPSVLPVELHVRPVPALTGAISCYQNEIQIYTTDEGMNSYAWVVSAGGIITAGGGSSDNTVTIQWMTAGSQTVSVDYENTNQCNALTPTVLNVTVLGLPLKPGTPTGDADMCAGSPDTPYTTTGAAGATSYIWAISPPEAGTITGNGLTGTVQWTPDWYGAANVTVVGQNAGGEGPVSDPLTVIIHRVPVTGNLYHVPSN